MRSLKAIMGKKQNTKSYANELLSFPPCHVHVHSQTNYIITTSTGERNVWFLYVGMFCSRCVLVTSVFDDEVGAKTKFFMKTTYQFQLKLAIFICIRIIFRTCIFYIKLHFTCKLKRRSNQQIYRNQSFNQYRADIY